MAAEGTNPSVLEAGGGRVGRSRDPRAEESPDQIPEHGRLDRNPEHGELGLPRPPSRALPDCRVLVANAAQTASASIACPGQ